MVRTRSSRASTVDMDAVHDFRTASTSTDYRELAGIAKRHCVDLPLSGRQDARLLSLRRRLMWHLGGADMIADAAMYIGPQPAAPPSPLRSISTSSSDVAEEDASPVDQPAASQRPAPHVDEDDAATPHAAHDACSSSCCPVPECSSQCTAASQPMRCMQCPVLLQRLHAAEAEATRLRAVLAETQSVSLVLQVTPPHSSSEPVAQPQVEAPPALQPPPAVTAERHLSPVAAAPPAAGRQQSAPPQTFRFAKSKGTPTHVPKPSIHHNTLSAGVLRGAWASETSLRPPAPRLLSDYSPPDRAYSPAPDRSTVVTSLLIHSKDIINRCAVRSVPLCEVRLLVVGG